MNITKTKQILVGLSVGLILALAGGCGETSNTSASLQSLASTDISTRGASTVAPVNPTILSFDHQSANVRFQYALAQDNKDFDGFYIHALKLKPGTTKKDLGEVTDWMTTLHPKLASIGLKTETFRGASSDPENPWDHNLTMKGLDANTTYALFPTSYTNYDVGGVIAKRDLLAQDVVIMTTALAPLPDPCLEVTGWWNKNGETFSRWGDQIVFGAHPTWCFAKDDNNESIFDGAELYRTRFIKDTDTLDETTLTKLDPTGVASDGDDIFDTERDLLDCGLLEHYKYRYTLQAYNMVGENKVYHDHNITADIYMTTENPVRECKVCETRDTE